VRLQLLKLAVGIVGGRRTASRLQLALVEQAIQILAVEDQRGALTEGHQVRAPGLVEGAALHPDVGQRLG